MNKYKIIWSYKLSPETLNLPAKGGVDEIQIFTLILKNENLKNDVLAAIDKAIPSPIIFILRLESRIKKEKQFKNKVELNTQLRKLNEEINSLEN